MIEGKEFARAIATGRKFMPSAATALAVDLKNQFLIEVPDPKNLESPAAYLWASDGYRAVRVKFLVHKTEGGPFIAAIRNPVFTPGAGTHVSIELGTSSRKKIASVQYDEYGACFVTEQPKAGQQTAKERLSFLKNALDTAIQADPKAKSTFNSRYLKDAVEALIVANSDSRIPISIAMTAPLDPILLRGSGVEAIVLPTRATVPENN